MSEERKLEPKKRISIFNLQSSKNLRRQSNKSIMIFGNLLLY